MSVLCVLCVSAVMQDMGSHCREINKKLMTLMTDLISKQLTRVSEHTCLYSAARRCVCVCDVASLSLCVVGDETTHAITIIQNCY